MQTVHQRPLGCKYQACQPAKIKEQSGRSYSDRLFPAVVRCFSCDFHVVCMAFPHTGIGDFYKGGGL